MGGIFFKKSGLEYTLCETTDFEPVSIFITDNTKLQNLFEVAKYLLLKYVKMYYLKIINHTGVKGPDGKYKFQVNRIPIDKKTFDLLYNSMFMWWSPGLDRDLDGDIYVIEDKLSDIFYMVINRIIDIKLGMTPNKDFEYKDIDANENEIEVGIEIIK